MAVVAVTGAGGFVGRRVTSALDAHGMAWTRVRYPDLPHSDLPPGARIRTLYHLGAEVSDVAQMEAVNVAWTRALVAWAHGRRVRVVYASSVTVTRCQDTDRWRHAPWGVASHTRRVYAETKRAAEQIVAAGDGVSVRLPTLYGGWGWRSWPLQAARSLLKREPVSAMRSVDWAVEELLAVGARP